MPLEILVALVVGGIAGIAVLTHFLGWSRQVPFTADSARAAWLRAYPDDAPEALIVARSGQAALVQTSQGAGLVWRFGADSTARMVRGARVASGRSGLRIVLADPGAPVVKVRLDPDEIALWSEALT